MTQTITDPLNRGVQMTNSMVDVVDPKGSYLGV